MAAETVYRIRRMRKKDIEQAQLLAQKVWAEQAFRDTGKRVEYPIRARRMFEGYLRAEPRGNFVALQEDEVIGAAYGHKWGKVGWVGPIEVSPELQGKGVGSALMHFCQEHLEKVGCEVVGVETKGNSQAHIGFYQRLGYSVHSPSFFYEKKVEEVGLSGETVLLPYHDYEPVLSRVSSLSEEICPGLDLSSEFWMSHIANLGRILVYQDLDDPQRLLGAAIVYGRTMEGLDSHLLRLLIVDPKHEDQIRVARALLQDAEFLVRRMHGSRLFFSSSVTASSVELLTEMHYRAIGNNVRMTRGGRYEEKGEMQIISWAG